MSGEPLDFLDMRNGHMKAILKRTLTSVAMAALVVSPLANATNGYFLLGAGSKNRGMAGAGIAFPQDSMASAVNPASLAAVGNRVDVGAEFFKPKRKGEVDATGLGVPDLGFGARQGALSSEKSGSNVFFIPHLGFSKVWTDKLTVGFSIVGAGGMNTRYGDANGGNGNIYTDAFAPVIGDTSTATFQPGPSGFAGALEVGAFGPPVPAAQIDPNVANLYLNPNTTPALGINLAQVLITPTIAYKINEHNSIGFSPVIAYQTFRAYGLGLFQALSSNPGKVTNNGNDDSYGFGAQVGYMGTFGRFSVGAMARSKVYMDEFSKYAGLFAEQGDFDIPPTFGVGIGVQATSKLTIAADVSRILYSEVAAVNNKGPTANEFFGAFVGALVGDPSAVSNPLGTNDGWGFGWDDVWVYKLGVNYAYNSDWTFRAGFNYAKMPYDKDQALFNVLAPAVVEQHVTAGFTRSLSPDSELTFTYMHAFRNDVEYTYTGTGGFAGQSFSAKNDMYQNAFELSYGPKF
jgi:long-chain fatty acid transport protein